MIIKLPVFISVGHRQFNYRWYPNLNLREISESESEANNTHIFPNIGVCNRREPPSILTGDQIEKINVYLTSNVSSLSFFFVSNNCVMDNRNGRKIVVNS